MRKIQQLKIWTQINMGTKNNFLTTLILALIPLLFLGFIVYVLIAGGPTKFFQSGLPPVEEIHVLRHTLENDEITLEVINSGVDPTTIAQVMVRGAFWNHQVIPQRTLKPLQKAQIIIPFPWNLGEPVEILLLTSTGLTFDYEIEVATLTPKVTSQALVRFAILGTYVGVIPVALGICWFPFLRRLKKRTMDFIIYFTVGLLVFLAIDAIAEGLEIAGELPSVFHGLPLFALGLIGAFLILMGVETQARGQNTQTGEVLIAWLISFGIGFHNLGEGLAIGSAYSLGELTLGVTLIVGFTIHNVTEGIAIVAPILTEKVRINRLIGLGLLAGVPTILGCWIGAFNYSQVWALLFLGVGAGAIIQVIGIILGRRQLKETFDLINVTGMLAGYLLMYVTGVFVGGS